jgi:hypothetical protein
VGAAVALDTYGGDSAAHLVRIELISAQPYQYIDPPFHVLASVCGSPPKLVRPQAVILAPDIGMIACCWLLLAVPRLACASASE